MPTELVLLAPEQALTLCGSPRRTSLSTPTGTANIPALPAASASPSFSRPGNPYDNALTGYDPGRSRLEHAQN